MPGINQDRMNRATPAAARAKLGDVVADLIAQVNTLTAKHNALATKLDADVGVTDINYAATIGVPAAAVKDLESR